MEQEKKRKAISGLAAAGFILGLIALLVSIVPCLGMYALIPGIISIILAITAFAKCRGIAKAPRGLVIAALIISVLGTSIGTWQFIIIRQSTSRFEQVGFDIREIFRIDTTNQIDELKRIEKEEEEEEESEVEELIRKIEEKDTLNPE